MQYARAPILLTGLITLWLFAGFTQETQIRVEVDAVNVLVTVTDRKGRFVTNLGRDKFRVYDDGKLQEITHFSHQTDLPLQIALLIDTSSSVRLKLDFEKRAATNFVHSVMRARDQALLVEFDTGVSLLHDFTGSPSAIAREIQRLRAGGGTALLDALYLVAREKMTDPTARKTIVVVSDGMDLNSKRGREEVIEMAQRSGVTIYAIGTSRFGADVKKKGEDMLEELAEKTGGQAFFPYSADQLNSAFDVINRELRSQYSLAFVPQDRGRQGRFHRIEVEVKGKNLNVRHREGYFEPAEG